MEENKKTLIMAGAAVVLAVVAFFMAPGRITPDAFLDQAAEPLDVVGFPHLEALEIRESVVDQRGRQFGQFVRQAIKRATRVEQILQIPLEAAAEFANDLTLPPGWLGGRLGIVVQETVQEPGHNPSFA